MADPAATPLPFTLAWLAQGKVRVKEPGQAPRTIESRFGELIRERAVQAQQRHGWKSQSGGGFLSGAALWGNAARDPAAVRVAVTSLCRGAAPGQLLYSLESDELCAVLSVEGLGAEEKRIWNKNDKRLSHLSVAPDGAVAGSVQHRFGTANLAVRLNDESGFSEVTEGDSVDTAPCWVPGQNGRLLFQSAGVGRDRQGNFAGLGPYSIQQLDIHSGELKTLAEAHGQDLLTPRLTEDGTLYYIRRPYTTGRELHPGRFLKDLVIFPFRLAYAVLQFLQFFSMRYTGNKLTSAGGARGRHLDLKEMMIWGNLVAAQQAEAPADEAPDLVPKSWQLVRHRPQAEPEAVAKGVLAFDLAPDGSLIYSNGSAIFRLGPDGSNQRLFVERLVEQITVLGQSVA